ncbi:MAG TPA: hypothetical protein VEQ40_02995 [Pyrinomonadaceae bacterium]|nr:hypothetical protein [Pyrinomonadaceae bacterium]
MRLAIYDTFERKVTAIETLIWMVIYMVGLMLFIHVILWPAMLLFDYFFAPSVFRGAFPSIPFD